MSGTYVPYPPSSGGVSGSVTANTIGFSIGQLDGQSPTSNGGSVSSASIFFQSATVTYPGLVSSASQTFSGSKNFSNQVLLANGVANGTPSLAFTNEPRTGFYRTGIGNMTAQILGLDSFGITQVTGSNTNFGFGSAASVSLGNALNCAYTYNGQAIFAYANLSQGTASSTVLYVGCGASGTNPITIENLGFSNATYTGGGGILSASANLSFLNICAENGTAYITFNVQGRTLATERMRLNYNNLTLNGGTSLVLVGSSTSASTLTQNANTTGSAYSFTWPGQQGFQNSFLQNTGSGTGAWSNINLSQSGVVGSGIIGSISLTNQVVGNLPVTQTSGSISLVNQVTGNLPVTQTSGSISLTNQVVNNLPLTQTSGSISLTTQVSGILPQANHPTSLIFSAGATIGSVSVTSSTSGGLYSIVLPGTQGSSTASYLTNNGTGKLNWTIPLAPTKTVISSGSSLNYTAPIGCNWIKVTLIGGGGSGGGCSSATTTAGAGGGGGGAGSVVKYVVPSGNYSYIIGAGGAAPAAGANAGNTGTNSVFSGTGASLIASGGIGGALSSAINAVSQSGSAGGGAATGGDINVVGGGGSGGLILSAAGAQGGSGGGSLFATATGSNVNGPGALAATGPGGGGGGGTQINNNGAQAGAAGQTGILLVEEYYL